MSIDRDDPAYRGQSDYNRLLLNLYDPLVLGPIARVRSSYPAGRSMPRAYACHGDPWVSLRGP